MNKYLQVHPSHPFKPPPSKFPTHRGKRCTLHQRSQQRLHALILNRNQSMKNAMQEVNACIHKNIIACNSSYPLFRLKWLECSHKEICLL